MLSRCGIQERMGTVVLLFLLGITTLGMQGRLPSFTDYPVGQIFRGAPAKPQFTKPAELPTDYIPHSDDLLPDSDLRYRQTTEENAAAGPNFAGRYTIAEWSCGSGCSSFVVIDSITGKLYRAAPYGTLLTRSAQHQFSGMSYRLDSTLLIVDGCYDSDQRRAEGQSPDCFTRYYLWVAPRFKLLRRAN
jgi:hypothetical protein